jgi:hypothetical protein
MGKRKMHETAYYQCDWTGLPMKSANCFMPNWTHDGKLVKKGTYCNWESVVAHARASYVADEQQALLRRIEEYVSEQIGGSTYFNVVDLRELEHFGGSMSAKDYHSAFSHMSNEVFGVKILESGHQNEILMDTNAGKLCIEQHLKRPPLVQDGVQPSMFQSYRKGKHKEKDLCVFYYPNKNGCELNNLASSLFKMQIYGECLLVECTREASFMPRERFVNYTFSDFQDNFIRKRKRAAPEQTSMRPEEYDALKAEMQASLCSFEHSASALAQPPSKGAKVARMPPADGRQLAALAKHRDQEAAAAALKAPPPVVVAS